MSVATLTDIKKSRVGHNAPTAGLNVALRKTK